MIVSVLVKSSAKKTKSKKTDGKKGPVIKQEYQQPKIFRPRG